MGRAVDEQDLGGSCELRTKAHFRRQENNFTFERRTGIEPDISPAGRLQPLCKALMNQIVRFCKLNAPTYEEICFALADALTFIECNPTEIGSRLSNFEEQNAKVKADPKYAENVAGAAYDLTKAMADVHYDYGFDAAVRALSLVAAVAHKNEVSLRALGDNTAKGPEPRSTETDDDFPSAPSPFYIQTAGRATRRPSAGTILDDLNDLADKLGIRRSFIGRDVGTFTDQVNERLDRANVAGQEAQPTDAQAPTAFSSMPEVKPIGGGLRGCVMCERARGY